MDNTVLSILLQAGPIGIVCGWLMFRLEKIVSSNTKAINLMSRAIIRLLERESAQDASTFSKELSRVDGTGSGEGI